MHSELLGASLPQTAAGWCFAFFAIIAALSVLLAAVEQFSRLFGGQGLGIKPLAGLALPCGGMVWSVALLYWKITPATVLCVLLGTLAITIAMVTLLRRGPD